MNWSARRKLPAIGLGNHQLRFDPSLSGRWLDVLAAIVRNLIVIS
jgi:hypothetical protein